MGSSNIKSEFINYLMKDNIEKVKEMLENVKNQGIFFPDDYINKEKTFTALNICSSCGSIKCAKFLIEKKWTINCPEKEEKNTSLMLACKFGFLELVKLYIDKYNSPLNYTNVKGMNILDISIIYGQYDIAYYLHKEMGLELRPTASDYADIMKKNKINQFDIQKFYNSLVNKIIPQEAKSFSLKRKTKEEKEEEIINNLGRVKKVNNNNNNNNHNNNNNKNDNDNNNNNIEQNNINDENINVSNNNQNSGFIQENPMQGTNLDNNNINEEEDEEGFFGTNKVSQKKTHDYIEDIIIQEGFVEHDDVFYHPNVSLKTKKPKNLISGYKLINN